VRCYTLLIQLRDSWHLLSYVMCEMLYSCYTVKWLFRYVSLLLCKLSVQSSVTDLICLDLFRVWVVCAVLNSHYRVHWLTRDIFNLIRTGRWLTCYVGGRLTRTLVSDFVILVSVWESWSMLKRKSCVKFWTLFLELMTELEKCEWPTRYTLDLL